MSGTPLPEEPDLSGCAQDAPAGTGLPEEHDFLEELRELEGIEYEMTPDQESFYNRHAHAHLLYAHSMLGSKQAAKAVVRHCYVHTALNWDAIREKSPEAYVWKLLKQRVAVRLRLTGRPSQMAQTAAFHRAVRATLEAGRRQFAVMESPLGLYTAIAGLPERQFDVIVMHYVLGFSSAKVAATMGIKPDTVRAHRRLARERIATKLGLSLNPTADEKEKEQRRAQRP